MADEVRLLVGGERGRLEARITESRRLLETELNEALEQLRRELPAGVLSGTVRDFLQLQGFLQRVPVEGVPKDRERRVTRSLAAKVRMLSIAGHDTLHDSSVTQTPRFHPGLPETPAVIRNARSTNAAHDLHKESSVFNRRTTRVARATIRPSAVQHSTDAPRTAVKRPAPTSTGKENVGGILSVELTNGKVLDVDITQSPSQMVGSLGREAIRDMKKTMQAYAAQLKSFFKRLKVSNN